ncbi:hypothetical protein D9M72_391490 [compost metagenome]
MQDAVGDPAFGSADHFLIVCGFSAAEPAVELVQGFLRRGVDEEAVHVSQGVVAGGAFAFEGSRQLLPRLQDLLDQQVAAAGRFAEPPQVALRVSQPVRVVDPETVRQPLAEPAEHFGMGFVEHPGNFHPDAGQRIDGEETAVVEVRVRAAPPHQFVVLAGVDVTGVIAVGKAALGQREPVVVVAEFAVADLQLVQVVIAPQHWEPDPSAAEVPVDVERLGVRGLPALLEQGPPPGVLVRRRDPDVVGHNVHEDAHAGCAGRPGHRCEALGAAAVGVHRGRVRDVVAVV